MKTTFISLLLLSLCTFVMGVSTNNENVFFKQILPHYLSIQEKLASDSMEGLNIEAQSILKKISPSEISTHKRLHPALLALSKATTLEEARKQFKPLSQSIVAWALSAPLDEVEARKCTMVKAVWLQKKGVNTNPYYGKKMLSCGQPYQPKNP